MMTYEDYIQRISIRDALLYAGYVHNRKDGIRYPSYVKLDVDGRRIKGDKFIITRGGQCCFHPPVQKTYNLISLIKEFPHLFPDYSAGMNLDLLVNKVCSRLLNTVYEEKKVKILEPEKEVKPFDIESYKLISFSAQDKESHKPFYPYFKHRCIDRNTQIAFSKYFFLAEKNGYRNLAFPIVNPLDQDCKIVGFEERGRMRRDGEKSYKGKAEGSNASQGLWIASVDDTKLKNAKELYYFESAYDAMAFYQLNRNNECVCFDKCVFLSSGGTPTMGQISGILKAAPKESTIHLCFDRDMAGNQFVINFQNQSKGSDQNIVREVPSSGFKDFNDELMAKMQPRTTTLAGCDLDGDGIMEMEETEERHKYHRI